MEDKKKADGYRQLALISDYQETFNSPTGKRVLLHLMKVHGFMDKSFVEGSPDGTAFNEGGRNVILQIVKKMKMSLKQIESMLIEESKQEEENNASY